VEHRAWGIASSSKFKFKNSPEISQKTWNLEHGTLNPIELYAASCLLIPSSEFHLSPSIFNGSLQFSFFGFPLEGLPLVVTPLAAGQSQLHLGFAVFKVDS
jgi:hypothetical protein